KHPVVISKFIKNAKEIEIDAVAENGKIKIYAISEHVENAGVHSGDATIVLPAHRLYWETERQIRDIAGKIAKSLNITGPFNIQFTAKDNDVKVIECNLRASRSFPFVSKVLNHNFIELATKAILGSRIERVKIDILDLDYVGVKTSQFSFSRLKGADPLASVEMASTGEVGCFGDDVFEAFMKSVISTDLKFPGKNILISVSGDKNRYQLLESMKMLKNMDFRIYSTKHTQKFLEKNNIDATILHKISERKKPNTLEYLTDRKIDLIISIPKNHKADNTKDDSATMRKLAVAYSIPLISNIQVAKMFIKAISRKKLEDLKIKSWDEYINKTGD
ncbi:MAG: ATP-grasp domain-containing protein, partial [Candidatus Heimdallarchaeota archaeon]|nr:ATP-grasp domain-containing protein [Candidatus Heimdallarchaeota archaeon]